MTEPTDPDNPVPTFEQVREKIETRFGTAMGAQELAEETPEGQSVEKQFAERAEAARDRLAQIRESMTGAPAPGDGARILLVPGFWLGAWAWDAVAERLRGLGDTVDAITLPGLAPEDERGEVTARVQAEEIVQFAQSRGATVLVSHSGGAVAATMAMDIAPQLFPKAIYVDSGPIAEGFAINPDLDPAAAEWPLPEWDTLRAGGSSLDGLDDAALARFRAEAVPEPARVARTPMPAPADADHLKVPTTVICTSITAEQLRQMRDSGVPMAAGLVGVDAEYVDLPTGHWPMWSRPDDLAGAIHRAANS